MNFQHKDILSVKSVPLRFFTCALGFGLATLLSGCEMNFPKFDVGGTMEVRRVNVTPAELVCVLSDRKKIDKIISDLADTYRSGWQRSYVSLAATYRISTGKNEILLLKKGIAIVVQDGNSEPKTFGHEFEEGKAEEIVKLICKDS
jgi:hypothetical protein